MTIHHSQKLAREIAKKYFIVVEIFKFDTCSNEVPTLHGPYGTKEEARSIIIAIIQALADVEPPECFVTVEDRWECHHEETADITSWSIVQSTFI